MKEFLSDVGRAAESAEPWPGLEVVFNDGERDKVLELVRMPSGDTVVFAEGYEGRDSYWFNNKGKHSRSHLELYGVAWPS